MDMDDMIHQLAMRLKPLIKANEPFLAYAFTASYGGAKGRGVIRLGALDELTDFNERAGRVLTMYRVKPLPEQTTRRYHRMLEKLHKIYYDCITVEYSPEIGLSISGAQDHREELERRLA